MTQEQAALADLVTQLAQAHVVVVGDVMLDRFISGTVERISPEAPIPIFKVTGETRMLGGAGNVVRNLATLGAATHFVGVIGNDRTGDEVASLLDQEDRATASLLTDDARPTTLKARYVAAGQQMLRADEEKSGPLTPALRADLLNAVETVLQPGSVLVLSDYGKGVLGKGLARDLIKMAEGKDIAVLVDPKGKDFSIYRGATLLTPNLKELSGAVGYDVKGDEAVIAAAHTVIDDAGLKGLLVTRSAEGMTLVAEDVDIHHQPAKAREVFDVSGAGDTVVATLAAALGAGAALPDAMRLANVAAGIAVGKVGTAAVRAADVQAELEHEDQRIEAKLAIRETVVDQVARWRRQGLSVGFTNGCFDLLHPGHVSLLNQAKTVCDRLIVGLNSDASVKRLKGETRPVQDEHARATVLGSMGSVDAVVVFDEDTPLELITALEPDVLVKGADYAKHEVVGADVVERRGGKVVLADLKAGHSTTNTIKRIL